MNSNNVRALVPIKVQRKPEITFWQYVLLSIGSFFGTYKPELVRASVFVGTCFGLGAIAFTAVSAAGTSPKSAPMPYNIIMPVPSTPQPVPAVTPTPPIEDLFEDDKGNEAAPVLPKFPQGKPNADAYIKRFAPIARAEMAKYGVPASISLAQGLIESRSGTSKLAVNNNNHFGMKCFSKSCRKGHCSNFTDDTHKDFFLKFGTAQQSWRAHSILLSSGRYAKLKKYGRDYRRWASGLKSVGYATDRTYAQKLIGVIERYDLHKYDR